jgi:arginase
MPYSVGVRRAPRLFVLPYDSGHRNVRMGAGPLRLREEFDLPADLIEAGSGWRTEIGTAFELYRKLAHSVASRPAEFPIVLGGNCGSCLGAAAGAGARELGVIWFDAHGDFNTPETSTTGFLDGMALSILAGRCFVPLSRTIPGFEPIPFPRIVHAGGHQLDPAEEEDFAALGVARIRPGQKPDAALQRLAANCSRLVIHIDLDVLDPRHGRANHYAAEGGMSPDEVTAIVEAAADRFDVAALCLASYDPAGDPAGGIAAAARRFAGAVLRP